MGAGGSMKNDFNPYEVLGVKSNATPETIKKKYRALCFRTHPDVGGDPEEFKKISYAYSLLSDAKRRQQYDENGWMANEETEETVESKAIRTLITIFESVIQFTLDGNDIIADTISGLNRMMDIKNNNIKKTQLNKKRLDSVRRRMKQKKGAKYDPILLIILERTKQEADKIVQAAKEEIEVLKMAKIFAEEYEYTPIEREEAFGAHVSGYLSDFYGAAKGEYRR